MQIKGEVLRKIRKAKKMTQEQLALELHVTTSTISNWERKDYVPGERYTIAIANVLDVSVYKLTGYCPTDSTHINAKSKDTYEKEKILLEHLLESFEQYKQNKKEKVQNSDNNDEKSWERGWRNG